MDNKYVLLVMAAVMATVGYYLSHMPYFANAAGETSNAYWYGMIIAVGLGAGSTGGSDAVSILMEGITGYISTMINLAIFGAVVSLAVGMGLMGEAFDITAIVRIAATFVVAGLMTNLILSYLKKGA
jgi:hypothetical protein